MHLSINDVQRFFIAKSIPNTCPVCSSEARYITGFGNGEATTALTYCDHPEGPVGYLQMLPSRLAKPVVAVECSNCGNVQCFAYHVIFNWVLQNPSYAPIMPPPHTNAEEF